MNTLLTAIVLWLSINFGLPANHDHPRVAFVPAHQLTTMHFGDALPIRGRGAPVASIRAGAPEPPHDILAVYSVASGTIYLSESWTGETPAELSILVHEMVHHLQHVGGLRHVCAQEREKLAFAAQDRWLGLFGKTLAGEFGLDGFTLLARTSCGS